MALKRQDLRSCCRPKLVSLETSIPHLGLDSAFLSWKMRFLFTSLDIILVTPFPLFLFPALSFSFLTWQVITIYHFLMLVLNFISVFFPLSPSLFSLFKSIVYKNCPTHHQKGPLPLCSSCIKY